MSSDLTDLTDLLDAFEAPYVVDGGHVGVDVPCDSRGAVRVGIEPRERTLALSAFLMRRPDRNAPEVHARLLALHSTSHVWRFALDRLGDVYVLAVLPRAGLTAAGLEEALSALSLLVDRAWEGLVRTGFDVPDDVSVTGPPPGAA